MLDVNARVPADVTALVAGVGRSALTDIVSYDI